VTFDVDARDLSRAADGLELVDDIAASILASSLDELGADALADIRRRAGRHRRTGRMLDQIVERDTGEGIGTVVRVSAGGPIASLVVTGSRAHDIAPIRSHALTIGAKGGGPIRAFAARVHHPGTRPDPFVADALAGSIESADRELELAGDRIASELATVMEG
jgi:hypothetical protein